VAPEEVTQSTSRERIFHQEGIKTPEDVGSGPKNKMGQPELAGGNVPDRRVQDQQVHPILMSRLN
jgi:hypothetical protein